MKGSIRIATGLALAFGAAGGMDTATDTQLLGLVAIALVGIAILTSGVLAVKSQQNAQ